MPNKLNNSYLSFSRIEWNLYTLNLKVEQMGNTTEVIRMNGFKRNLNILLNIKLSRLRDYFATFKSICDNFSIDLTEFQHIFEAGESSFVVWDTDNNGLIDSLELFAGIAIFSDTKIQDKIRFLFDVFDFNEVESLELIQLEFMIYCCVSASFKIYSIPNQIANQEIQEFSKELFPENSKITVAELIKKGKENLKIKEFFQLLKADNAPKHKE